MRPLSRHEVEVGKALSSAVYDREGKLLLESGHVPTSERQCEMLIERGYVSDARADARAAAQSMQGPAQESLRIGSGPATTTRAWPSRVGAGIQRLRDELRPLLLGLSQGPGKGCKPLPEAMKELSLHLRTYVEQDADAVLAHLQLGARNDGIASRPIHAGALMLLITRVLELPAGEQEALLHAALTFDCALAPLARVLNEQRGELSPEQRAAVQEHTQRGVEWLRAAGVEDPLWLQAVAQHHERIDGSGYPQGLVGDQICRGARLLALLDTYCAMVRPRAYRGAIAATEAIRTIFLERGRRVDEGLAAQFVREIGVYPPGGLVRLENNEIAVVYRRGGNASKPRVRCLVDSYGRTEVERHERDTSVPGFAIAESLSNERYQGLLPGLEKLWD